MKKYPVLFTYLEKVEGQDFLAFVTVNGRALLVEEDEGGWWMYGVNPGGMAAGGDTQLAARCAIRQAFTEVLYDIAAEAKGLEDFRAAVRQFFDETNKPTEAEWVEAVAEVRAGRLAAPNLPTEPAESPRGVTIEERQHFAPSGNVIEPTAAIAA